MHKLTAVFRTVEYDGAMSLQKQLVRTLLHFLDSLFPMKDDKAETCNRRGPEDCVTQHPPIHSQAFGPSENKHC